jgi:hypothetical protein
MKEESGERRETRETCAFIHKKKSSPLGSLNPEIIGLLLLGKQHTVGSVNETPRLGR